MTTAGLWVLLFGVNATLTIAWCSEMSASGGMPMPGGWAMSMAWMRMPGQTWSETAAAWLVMWIVMMIAMMLPSLVPMLSRCRDAVSGAGAARPGALTAIVGVGYFCVWMLVGMIAFPAGFALAEAEMRHAALSRAVPATTAAIVLIAGACQFTAWKAHHLACCRGFFEPGHTLPLDSGSAWRQGLRLGLHCCYSSAGLTAILLVMGVMDLRVMAAVTVAITAERLAAAGEVVARAIGIIVVCAGVSLLARAAGLQ